MEISKQIKILLESFKIEHPTSASEVSSSPQFQGFTKASDLFISMYKTPLAEVSAKSKIDVGQMLKDLLFVLAVKTAIDQRIKTDYLSKPKNQVLSHQIADAWGENEMLIRSLADLVSLAVEPSTLNLKVFTAELAILAKAAREGLAHSGSRLQIGMPCAETTQILSFSSHALSISLPEANDYSQLENCLNQYLDSL